MSTWRGKRARAEFRDREVEEADALVAELTALSRSARLRTARVPPAAPAVTVLRQAGTRTLQAGTSSATGTRAAGPSTWRDGGTTEAPDGAYDCAVKRIGKWSMERMPGRVDERVIRLDLVVGNALVPLPQGDPQLEPGQVRPEAAVDAAPEGDVPIDLAVETHLVGVREFGLVACWPSRS